ncbi:hypothetical protein BHE74_00048829 [Ensete ventricosum]|nr:hypothetical protein BHE74_00048829 [Ensete ventricosum]
MVRAATGDGEGCGNGQRCGYVANEDMIEEEGNSGKQGHKKQRRLKERAMAMAIAWQGRRRGQRGPVRAVAGEAGYWGTVDEAGQQLAATVGRWPRAGEGGGSGINMRSAQRWLWLRAREAAVKAALEEKGIWWSAIGAKKEEGAATMPAAVGGGEEKGDGRGCD